MSGTTQSYNIYDSAQYRLAKMMIKRLDKEAYDKAQRGYVAPTTLAPAGLEAHGAAHPMLTKLKEQLMAKLAKGQEVVQRNLTTPIKERIKGRSKEQPTPTAKTPQ